MSMGKFEKDAEWVYQPRDCATYTYICAITSNHSHQQGRCSRQPCHCAVPHIWLNHNSTQYSPSNTLPLSCKDNKPRLIHYLDFSDDSIHITVCPTTDLDTKLFSRCDSFSHTKAVINHDQVFRMESTKYHHTWCMPGVLPQYWLQVAINSLGVILIICNIEACMQKH